MKRIVFVLLAALLLFTMISCGKEDDTLMVGFGRESIHPTEPVPLAGFGNTSERFSEFTLDVIQSTCIAFRQGEETCLLFTNDLSATYKSWSAPTIEEISKVTGVPTNCVFISATHTHSGPDVTSSEPVMEEYRIYLKEQMVKAAENAIADLAPATLYGSKTNTENLNFIRHYKMADGTVSGDNFGNAASGYIGHVGENDPEMIVIKAEREGDKKDIIIVNWQAHLKQTGTGGQKNISADYVAPFRNEIEGNTGAYCAFIQGAAGNENPTSRMSEPQVSGYKSHGVRLANYALSALENLEKIEGAGIEFESVTVTEEYTRDKIELYEEAKKAVERWTSTGVMSKGDVIAQKYGMECVYEANAIKSRAERIQRGELSIDVTYYATKIGGMAFISAPYEIFAESGKFIKENSPFEYTMVTYLTNDCLGYYATEAAYDYNSYEAYSSRFPKGIAERTADRYVEMLKKLQK